MQNVCTWAIMSQSISFGLEGITIQKTSWLIILRHKQQGCDEVPSYSSALKWWWSCFLLLVPPLWVPFFISSWIFRWIMLQQQSRPRDPKWKWDLWSPPIDFESFLFNGFIIFITFPPTWNQDKYPAICFIYFQCTFTLSLTSPFLLVYEYW